MSSKSSSKSQNKSLKSISHAGSLMDIKTFNKMDTALLNSFYNYDNPRNMINDGEDEEMYIKKSTTNFGTNKENKLLNTDLYKIFCKSHPPKFKNPIEQVKTVSDVTLPTIADYKNKLYYHNHKSIDINKKDTNINSKIGKFILLNIVIYLLLIFS